MLLTEIQQEVKEGIAEGSAILDAMETNNNKRSALVQNGNDEKIWKTNEDEDYYNGRL